MSREFMCSCGDHFGNTTQGYSDVANKWDSVGAVHISFATGRNGGLGYSFIVSSQILEKNVTSHHTYIFGFAMIGFTTSNLDFLLLKDTGTTQLTLRLNTDGTLSVTRNGTVLATSVRTINNSNYRHVGLKVFVDNTVGTWQLWIDGTPELSGVGDTQNTANNRITSFRFVASSSASFTIDDLYVFSSLGSTCNDFIGDARVRYTPAAAEGSTSQWTANTGTKVSRVNEVPEDQDTGYIKDATPGEVQLFTVAPGIPADSIIYAMQPIIYARKDDGTARQICGVVKPAGSGTIFSGAAANTPSTYGYIPDPRELNPATAAPWTATEINTLEIGVKVVA